MGHYACDMRPEWFEPETKLTRSTKMTRGMNRLDMIQSAELVDYIRNNYAEARMTDRNFAAKATKDLGYLVLDSHVEKRRVAMGIKPTSNRPSPKNTKALFEMLVELERRVAALEGKRA